MRIPKPLFYYLLMLSLAGAGLVLLATSLYGAGVSADAAKNLSTAASLLAGHGFFDHTGQALVYWPPLYPLLLAGISWLTGWDVFVSGWYLNILGRERDGDGAGSDDLVGREHERRGNDGDSLRHIADDQQWEQRVSDVAHVGQWGDGGLDGGGVDYA